MDFAISGNIIVTPEIHKIACERNGEPAPLVKYSIYYKLIKNAIKNSAVEKNAKKIRQNLTLNGEDFHTALSLYNEINQHYEEFMKVSTSNTARTLINRLTI